MPGVQRIDQFPDIGSAIPAGAVLLFEINPTNPATRDYRQGLASLLAPTAPVLNSPFTFSNPGDLSVSYATRVQSTWLYGNVLIFHYELVFTPTYGTSTGNAIFGGLPFNVQAAGAIQNVPLLCLSNVAWPGSATQLALQYTPGTTSGVVRGIGSGTAGALWTTTQFPSGTARSIRYGGAVKVDL